MLDVGHYKTEHGSYVHVITKNAGSWSAEFDKFEEPDGCFDCRVDDVDHHEQSLVWSCDYCGGGKARLTKIDDQ